MDELPDLEQVAFRLSSFCVRSGDLVARLIHSKLKRGVDELEKMGIKASHGVHLQQARLVGNSLTISGTQGRAVLVCRWKMHFTTAVLNRGVKRTFSV
jgi:hypothetical protein